MQSSRENKPDADAVFNRWLAEVRADKLSQYSYGDRKKHIQNLIGFLIQNNIEQLDAQMLKNQVIKALVTEKGMKGKERHRGWKENVEADFNDAIQMAYVPGLQDTTVRPMKTAQGYDPRIVKWAKDRFGDHVGEDIIIAAHQPLHLFWLMFMKDYYKLDMGIGAI